MSESWQISCTSAQRIISPRGASIIELPVNTPHCAFHIILHWGAHQLIQRLLNPRAASRTMPVSPPRSPLPSPRRQRQAASSSTIPSQTQTETVAPPNPEPAIPTVTLRLRATAAPNDDRRIRWAEDVVDNEGLGRKKSKGMYAWVSSEPLWC